MVYGGKPSTGCYLCRKRKIKCDEALPQCRNCIVYGKPCPGYRPDAIFRNETQKVERMVKRINNSPENQSQSSRHSSRELSPRSHASSSSSSSSGGSSSQGSPLTLYRVADSTWDERAICYFFDQYTTYGESDDCVTHLGFLPSLYSLCKETTGNDGPASWCLRQAVDATAFLALGNEVKSPAMTVKARSSYGMALRGVRQALQSRSQAVKDETFTAVVLLSLFEDITGERNGILSSHTEGFQFLMKLRGQEQLEHRRGRDLFNFAYTHTHIEILAMGDKPRFNTEWILSMLNDSDPEHRLMVTSSKISDLLIEAAAAARSTQFDFGTLGKISGWIESGKLLDRELVEWSRNLPENWLPFVVYSQTGETLITYTRISIGAIWNYYRALRIVLQKLILVIRRILKSVSRLFRFWCGDTSQEDATMRGVVQEMITDVCRSIPFSLGDIDAFGNPVRSLDGRPRRMRAFHGYTLLWPLWYVLICGMATPEQIQQVRKVLDHVGSVQGIKLASLLASEGDNPFTLAGSLPMDLSTM